MSFQPPIQCAIALKDDPRERLIFESMPSSFTESCQTQWKSTGGRTTAQVNAFWQSGSFGGFDLNLEFVAGLMALNQRIGVPTQTTSPDLALDAELQNMEAKARWLQALCFPRPRVPRSDFERGGGIVKGAPPRVILTIGRFLTLEGVASSWSVEWSAPFHPVTVRPYHCKVRMSFQRLETFYPDYYDIIQVASRRTPPVLPLVPTKRESLDLVAIALAPAGWVGSFKQKITNG